MFEGFLTTQENVHHTSLRERSKSIIHRENDPTYILHIHRKKRNMANYFNNLDSILKSRDITLQTKVCLVKAILFTVVMYGCESWTIKKAERQRFDGFELWS